MSLKEFCVQLGMLNFKTDALCKGFRKQQQITRKGLEDGKKDTCLFVIERHESHCA